MRTQGQTHVTKVIDAVHNFAKALKNPSNEITSNDIVLWVLITTTD
jgi:hypothetical protein